MYRRITVFFSVFLLLPVCSIAGVIHVPADQPTIQAGIDAAVEGDTVLVADGTYTGSGNKNLDFLGKAIVVRSENGPNGCIIDCEGSGCGVYFDGGEGEDSVLQGFTIRNGDFGGIMCYSSPQITGNIITGNTGDVFLPGGGIACQPYSQPTITNNIICGNQSQFGGGIFCNYLTNPIIIGNTITANIADSGGGIYLYSASATVSDTILWDNEAQEGPEISLTFDGYWGPAHLGISCSDVQGGEALVHVASGSTLDWGTDMIMEDPLFCDPDNENYHLAANSRCAAAQQPNCGLIGALDVACDATKTLAATLSCVPTSGMLDFTCHICTQLLNYAGAQRTLASRIDLALAHGALISDWRSGYADLGPGGTYTKCWNLQFPANGLLIGDNVFTLFGEDVTPPPYNQPPYPPSGDTDWTESTVVVVTDSIHVDDDAFHDPGPGDPTVSDPFENGSAAHPYDAIQEGIDIAVAGDIIVVADGTYSGPGNRDLDFLGKTITVRSQNGPGNCIVDCQADSSDQHRGFSFHSNEGPSSVLKGLTITNGYAGSGGAIQISSCSPIIEGCTLVDNTADNGGAILGNGPNLAPTITNCTIAGNEAQYGGAVCFGSSNPEGNSPVITHNRIVDNHATGFGGAIYNGDIFVCSQISNNLIANNSAGYAGGVYCVESFITISSCTFIDNSAGSGGCLSMEKASATVRNCILWGNTPTQIYDSVGKSTVAYSDVQGGYSGTGNIDADPLFVSGPWGDYYLSHVLTGQPMDSPCVDTGGDAAVDICFPARVAPVCLDAVTTRTDQNPDIGQVDMGHHYFIDPETVSASIACSPASGTVPFTATITATLTNNDMFHDRRMIAQVNVQFAGGEYIKNWKSGNTRLQPGGYRTIVYSEMIPELDWAIGPNVFTLMAEDVTPPPYNQPPYPPSGDTDTSACTVTGLAP